MIVEEVLMEVFTASPRDRAQQRFLVQITSTLLFLTSVEEVLGGGLPRLLPRTGLNSGL